MQKTSNYARGRVPDPTPQEIEERKAEIRREWGNKTRHDEAAGLRDVKIHRVLMGTGNECAPVFYYGNNEEVF